MIYVFLADGFEECEALAPVDILRRGGLTVKTVAVSGEKTVTGAHGISVLADITESETDFADITAAVLPGGMPGTENLKKSLGVKLALEKAKAGEKLIAAICAAPSVLGFYGYLDGKKATCFPGCENQLGSASYVNEPIVRDGKIITGCGAGAAFLFGFALLEYFKGKDASETLRRGMLYE